VIARSDNEGGTIDLTDEQIEKYTNRFQADEYYTQEQVEGSVRMEFFGFE